MGRLARVVALRSLAARGSCPTPSGRWLAVSSCASRDAVALADVAASALAPSSSRFDGSLGRGRRGARESLLQGTSTLPIVFVIVIDPVGAGFVASLARPGGNATGFLMFECGLSG